MTDHEKLYAIMEELDLGYRKIAKITGHTYNSVKTMLQPNGKLPRWVNFAIYIYENKPK